MASSIFFRSTVVSAMVAIGLWLLSTFFLILVAGAVADFFVGEIDSQEAAIEHFNLETWISRASPSFLFSEASDTLLNPTVRSLGVLLQDQAPGLLSSPISAVQSLRLVWPHIVAMISAVLVFSGRLLHQVHAGRDQVLDLFSRLTSTANRWAALQPIGFFLPRAGLSQLTA